MPILHKAAINLATKLNREYCYVSFVLPPLLSFCLGFGGFGNTFIHSEESYYLIVHRHSLTTNVVQKSFDEH